MTEAEPNITIDVLLEKLTITDGLNMIDWNTWSKDEQTTLLKIYLKIVKREADIYDLIWKNHECDSWEHLFRDYNENELIDKASGVENAIKTLENGFDYDTDDESDDSYNSFSESDSEPIFCEQQME
jgi:hypothetical protein